MREQLMPTSTITCHQSIDLSGLRCPKMVIATIHALAQLKTGQILQVIATDLSAPSNMAAWCRQSGNALVEMYEENGRFVFYIKKFV